MTDEKHKVLAEAADAVVEADVAVASAVEPYRKTLPVRLFGTLSELGDQPQMRTLCAAVIAAGLAGGNVRLARAGAKMLAAHTVATAAKNIVKNRIDRTRPRSRADKADAHKLRKGGNHDKEETSFPSGHTAGAVAVARAFVREYPEYAGPAYAAAGAIALAQVPRCAHYPSDVGAGTAVALASEALTNRVFDKVLELSDAD